MKDGIIDNCLKLLQLAPQSLCSTIAELFHILNNSSAIAELFHILNATEIAEPLFRVLLCWVFSLWGQHISTCKYIGGTSKSCNLEAYSKPSCWTLDFSSGIPIPNNSAAGHRTVISPSCAGTFLARYYNKVFSCATRTTFRIWNIELKANNDKSFGKNFHKLDKGSYWCRRYFWACKGYYSIRPLTTTCTLGISCFSSLNVLYSNADYYFKVPVVVLVKLLHSTLSIALNASRVHDRSGASSAEQMMEAVVGPFKISSLRRRIW